MRLRVKMVCRRCWMRIIFFPDCNQVAQTILAAGGKDFASTEFDGLDTRPNAVYGKKTDEILKEHPAGWNYGSLDNLLVGILYDGEYIREINNECIN